MLTDREIVMGYLKGESVAYRTVIGWIEEVVRTRLWEHGISPQDIVSDTSYKLLQNFRTNRFEFQSAVKTYIHQVTRFTIIDAVRRRRREINIFQSDSNYIPDPPAQEKQIDEDETRRIFQRILSQIDVRCLEVWMMIFNERLRYKEISVKLGVSEGTIKTRVFRCKEEAIAIRKSIE